MPRETLVNLGGAAGFTTIRATLALHTLKVYQDGARDTAFTYKRKDDGSTDGFTVEFTTQAGDPITLIGHGHGGIIGRPPNYNGVGYPVDTAADTDDSGGGDAVLMLKATDDSTPDVVVIENESEF
jgi:hypothetical protein